MTVVKKIGLAERISMLQTCVNSSASNFTGKQVTPKKITDFSNVLYAGMMKQIATTERDRLIAPKTQTRKKVTKTKADAIKKRIAKRNKK